MDHRLEVIVAEPLTHVQNFSALKRLGNELEALALSPVLGFILSGAAILA